MAAFTGYCAASAVAKWFNEGLSGFSEFYQTPNEPAPQTTSAEYKARYDSWE